MDDLWETALHHLDRGNFSALETALGGHDGFDRLIVSWHAAGKFEAEPEMLAEALTCSCMLGRNGTVRYLLDHGVDPYAGMKTGLAGPHYAVSGGHIEIVRLLIERKVPLEVRNDHGGTLLGQALWSAVNEHKPDHAAVIEALIKAGAEIEPGTLKCWQDQNVPSAITKERVADALRHRDSTQEYPKL